MTIFKVLNTDYEVTIRESFDRQGMLQHLEAVLTSIKPGEVVIEMPITGKVTQQHGYVHAGAIASIADTACGYAALSLMPPESEVLAVEFKLNFLAPARGERLRAVGRVVKPGRTVTVCQGEVFMADEEGEQSRCAVITATMIRRGV
jgi:uncharacterized protein (TIGR00369 family)